MDDRELKDIGITRKQAGQEERKPLWNGASNCTSKGAPASPKITGMPDDYFLVLALNPTEVRLFRDTGKPPLLSVRLDELSVEGICKAMWEDTFRR